MANGMMLFYCNVRWIQYVSVCRYEKLHRQTQNTILSELSEMQLIHHTLNACL